MKINKDTRLSAALAYAPGALAVPDMPASPGGDAATVRGGGAAADELARI